MAATFCYSWITRCRPHLREPGRDPRSWFPGRTLSNHVNSRTINSYAKQSDEEDSTINWELFQKYHAKGSWKGIWTTYDYIGDIVDEAVASVDLVVSNDSKTIQQNHQLVIGAKRSDCETCFDSMEIKTWPVATYNKDNVLRKARLASCGMVIGPSLLRSGIMATELILSHGDGRIRVIFQHAPVWERGIEPGSIPPQALKLFRTLVSREALRSTPPTPQSEQGDTTLFFRSIPPTAWHKQWAGTCWTWGPSTGNQGWQLEQLEENDAWHGMAPVEIWNLRLPGGIFLQAPRLISADYAGICRLAWLPNDNTLLRLESGVLALQPKLEDETLIGFEPPKLVSLRCDVLYKVGDLEGEPQFVRDSRGDMSSTNDPDDVTRSLETNAAQVTTAVKAEAPYQPVVESSTKASEKKDDGSSFKDPLDLLRL